MQPIDPAGLAAPSDRIQITPDVIDVLAPLTGMPLRTRKEAVGA